MKVLHLLFALLPVSNVLAELIVDSSFRPPSIEQAGTVTLAIPAPDGKVFIAGSFTSVSGETRLRLARVLADGRLDPSFDAGQVSSVTTILPLSDGRLLVAGSIATSDGQLHTGVLRLQTNGTIDLTFSSELPPGLSVRTLALAPGEKVVVGGAGGPGIARLLGDGLPDPSFQPGAGFGAGYWGNTVYGVAVQPDGRILAIGDFEYYDNIPCVKLARLNANGTLDQSFIPGISFWWDDRVFSLALRPDGKLWIAGKLGQIALRPNPTYYDYRDRIVALILPDGSLDSAITIYSELDGFVWSMAMSDDGRLVIEGEFNTINDAWHPSIARVNTNGSPDLSFNPPLSGSPLGAYPGNHTLLCSVFYRGQDWSTSVARLNADASVDESFRVVAGIPAEIVSVARQPDGKLVVVGNFQLLDGKPALSLARLNVDGSRDTNFDVGSGPAGSLIGAAVLTNGQIVVAGSFSSFNGKPYTSLCRLQPGGSVDESYALAFNPIGYDWGPGIHALARTQDGKVLLAGRFTGPRFIFARLNGDGNLDDSFITPWWPFMPDYPPLFWPGSVLPKADGSIFTGGSFSDCGIGTEPCWPDSNFPAIVRLTASGTPDLSFRPIAGRIRNDKTLQPLATFPDGKLLVKNYNRLQKFLPNGTNDSTFIAGTTDPNGIRTALVQSDGFIVLGGEFFQFNGIRRQRMARVYPNGALDSCFDAGSAIDGAVDGILPEPDSQWLIFGAFRSINGVPRTGLARVRWQDFCIRTVTAPTGNDGNGALLIIGPINRTVRLESSTNLTTWNPVATNTLAHEDWIVSVTNSSPQSFFRAVLLP